MKKLRFVCIVNKHFSRLASVSPKQYLITSFGDNQNHELKITQMLLQWPFWALKRMEKIVIYVLRVGIIRGVLINKESLWIKVRRVSSFGSNLFGFFQQISKSPQLIFMQSDGRRPRCHEKNPWSIWLLCFVHAISRYKLKFLFAIVFYFIVRMVIVLQFYVGFKSLKISKS